MTTNQPAPSSSQSQAAALHAVSLDEVAQDKALVAGAPGSPAADPALVAKAEQFVDALLSLDPADVRARQDGKSAIENMGLDLQRRAAQKSQMLKQPIKKLTERAQDNGDVGNALINLKMTVEEIEALKARLALREAQLERVNTLLTVNENAITEFDRVNNAVTEVRGTRAQASVDLETAIAELEGLAARARKLAA